MSHNNDVPWGKATLLLSLPPEILLLIGEFLSLEDLRVMIMTCSYMNTTFNSILYKRAIITGVHKPMFLYAAIWGRATAISHFLKEGVSMSEFDSHTHTWEIERYHYLIDTKKRTLKLDSEVHPLFAAAYFGQAGVVRTMLTEGNANVDFADDYGRTALVYTAMSGNIDVAKILLEHGAKLIENAVNQNIYSPLIFAAATGSKEVFELIYSEFQRRSISEKTILNQYEQACALACQRGITDIVEFFLLKGTVSVNSYIGDEGSLLYRASITANPRMMRLLLRYGAKMENELDTGLVSVFKHFPLPKATDVATQLLKMGCNVANGNRHACGLYRIARGYRSKKKPDLKLIELLCEKGFKKDNCQDGCWGKRGKSRYRFGWKDMFTERFFDYIKGGNNA
jgi:ankyrin repeat protein